MPLEPNLTSKFREALKREIPVLIDHGILTDESKDKVAALYQLDNLGQESSGLLTAVLYTIGGLLIGGGVMSFVAAHWDEISIGSKFALLSSLLLAFYLAGYWLRYRGGWPRIGHALIFCGCLIYGANIALLAQIYHLSGDWYGLFGIWAVGALLMAWAAQSWITGLLVVATSIIWFFGFANNHHERLATFYPLVLLLAMLPLAWLIRSPLLYSFTFLGFIFALPGLAFAQMQDGELALPALAAGGFLAWATGEFHRLSELRKEFSNPLVNLGIAALGCGAYFWSFDGIWSGHYSGGVNRFYWLIPAGCAVLAGVAALVFVSEKIDKLQRSYLIGVIIVFLLNCLAAVVGAKSQLLPVIITNLAALLIAAVCIAKGILEERRLIFWAGSLFVTLLVISRFFEYESSLILKSVAFILCGVIVMIAGVAYERFLHRKAATAQ